MPRICPYVGSLLEGRYYVPIFRALCLDVGGLIKATRPVSMVGDPLS